MKWPLGRSVCHVVFLLYFLAVFYCASLSQLGQLLLSLFVSLSLCMLCFLVVYCIALCIILTHHSLFFFPHTQRGGAGELCSLEEKVLLHLQDECQPYHWHPGPVCLQSVCAKGKP